VKRVVRFPETDWHAHMVKTYTKSTVKLIVLAALALALVFGAGRVEDHYTEVLIQEKISDLNNEAVINNAIRFAYQSFYTDLNALRRDYSKFNPSVSHWSEYGSATLHYLHIGWGLGYFSIRLPDKLVVIDADGEPHATRKCGSVEGRCELIPPDQPELGIVGTLVLANETATGKQPITDFLAQWSHESRGRVTVRNNCFWAYAEDGRGMKLTITPTRINSITPEYKSMFGFYEINEELHPKVGGKGHGIIHKKRITKGEFLAKSNCTPSGS
jgi:hypothetical protein